MSFFFQNLYICFVFPYQGRNGQEFLSFLVVSPLFFWLSGCSELEHGFLIRNTLQVFKKLKRSCKYELATATKVRISRKYDETSDNWSNFIRYYEKNWKKRNIYTWIQLQDSFRAIFTERFAIVKVYLFYLNATSDQLTQNLPHLSKIHLGEFPFIHSSVYLLPSNGFGSGWEGLR